MIAKEDELRYRKEWMLEVLKMLRGRLDHLNEILRLTKEISDGLSRNDRVSAQLSLEMRGKEMEKVASNMKKLHMFKEQFPEETKKEIECVLKGEIPQGAGTEAEQIVIISKNCKKILDQAIAIDRQMSLRVAGADSFYK